MKKLLLIPLCLTLVACGVTKVDIPAPVMEEVRKYYPDATGGYIIIKTKPYEQVE